MSFTIYNGIAYHYNKNRENKINLARDELSNDKSDSIDLETKLAALWVKLEIEKPSDYDYYCLPDDIAEWLITNVPEFSFKENTLSGKTKTKLCKKLKRLRKIQKSIYLKTHFNNLSNFLLKYDIVFTSKQ